ncbi:MAG: hypothetical protein NTV57_07865 [Cyanobacteria bacterium]|nr:hypothetical protein [Cyanobacteriota bacterium]
MLSPASGQGRVEGHGLGQFWCGAFCDWLLFDRWLAEPLID